MINLNLLNTKNFSKIKCGGGVVGKTSNVGIVLLIVIGFITYNKIEDQLIILALVVAMVGLFVFYLIKILSFAEKNPEIAVLEGMELVSYKEVDLASKSIPNPAPNNKSINNSNTKLTKGLIGNVSK